jgi:DNA polymerase-3 subunit beta
VRLVGQSRDTAPIRLAHDADGLELSAIAQDVGEAHESVEAKFDGAELIVRFNAQFLLDGIEAAGSSELVLETVDPLKPPSCAPRVADFLYLLMPVRIA